ncbi:hypothetical protein L484_008620 [Morus notabilis]|uniref:Uncharacterized protein n=1 Tax=Morus notabilis TaxID=981085 RepID=W9SII5_9ROSA|nr:hypothetical protein L484_008620 [Morus notabilis]
MEISTRPLERKSGRSFTDLSEDHVGGMISSVRHTVARGRSAKLFGCVEEITTRNTCTFNEVSRY